MYYNVVADIDNTIETYSMPFYKEQKMTSIEIYLNLRNKFKLDLDIHEMWAENPFFVGEYLYEDHGYEILIEKLSSFSDTVYLAVTEESSYPWIMYYGPKSLLPELLYHQIYFEYFIFDLKFEEILFDTHYSSFVKLRREDKIDYYAY